jgi:two-component system sensor histidine kinase/response regulator
LDLYVQHRADDVQILRQHLAVGAFEYARRVAHTLKGTAGTLSAVDVQLAAAAVETALRHGECNPETLEPLLAALDAAHRALVAGLTTLRSPPAPPVAAPSMPAVDRARRDEVVSQLQAWLEASDIQAVKLAKKEQGLLAVILGPDRAAEFLRRVEHFDFENALTLFDDQRLKEGPDDAC